MDKTSILYLQTEACSGKGLREDGDKGLVTLNKYGMTGGEHERK